MNILIVGAGPTGLTAALELARYGIHAKIVEKNAGPSNLSRAVGIMPASIEKLTPSGVGAAILREGLQFKKIEIHRGGKRLAQLDFSETAEYGSTIIGLAQDRTETLMREALERLGVTVQYDCEAIDINTDDERATVVFRNGESQGFDWVIAADGVSSVLRGKLGIAYKGYDLDGDWSIADVEISGGYDPETFSAWLHKGGRATIIAPIEQKRLRVVSATPDAMDSLPIALDIINVRRSATFKISVRQAESYKIGKVLLAGDAAHCHSPVGGKGMNLGIDDAVAAAKAIVDRTTDQYSDARHQIGARVIRVTETGRKAIFSGNPLVKTLIWIVLRSVSNSSFLKKIALREITRV